MKVKDLYKTKQYGFKEKLEDARNIWLLPTYFLVIWLFARGCAMGQHPELDHSPNIFETYWLGITTVTGIMLGTVYGVYYLIRLLKKESL